MLKNPVLRMGKWGFWFDYVQYAANPVCFTRPIGSLRYGGEPGRRVKPISKERALRALKGK